MPRGTESSGLSMLSQRPEALLLWMSGSLDSSAGSHASRIFFDMSLAERIIGAILRRHSLEGTKEQL